MKRLILLLAIVSGLAPSALAGRNFGGVWRMLPDSQRATIDTVFSGAAMITIRMTGNKMTLVAEAPRLFEEYIIDGDDHPLSTRLGPMTYATSWEGDTLVITRTPVRKTGIKTRTVRFSMSSSGQYMIVTCTLEGDKEPQDVLRWEKR